MNDSVKKRILLVEDEAILAMTETMQLEKYGYAVAHVTTGEHAVETVRKSCDLDLILMDINLGPGIDGTQAAEIILKDHDIPIVFLSSHTEPEVVGKTEKITSYGYVVKNSNIAVLDASIKMAFKLFDAKQAHARESAALERSEERFRSAQEMSPDGFTILHPVRNEKAEIIDFTWVYENDAIARINGTDPESVVGKHLLEIFPNHRDTPIYGVYVHVANTGASRTIEEVFVGDIISQPKSLRLVVVSMGTDIAILSQDITKQKQQQEALETERQRLSAILDGTNVGTWEWNVQTGETRFNERWATIIGYTMADISPVSIETWQRFTHPEDLQRSEEALRAHFAGEAEFYEAEARMRHKDGHWVWVFDRGKVTTWTEDGKPEWVFGTHDEITERKRLQESLQLRSEILEHIGQAVIATDVHGEVFFWNHAAELMYGISSENALGKNIVELTPAKQTREQAIEIMAKLSQGDNWSGEFTVQRKSGDSFPAYVTNTPLFDDSGNLTGIIGISTDVTERKRAAEEIQKQLADKELLVREVHHRVKNNMANIESLLSLQTGSSANAEVKSALQKAVSRVQSMRVLYDKLLLSTDLREVSIRNYVEALIDSLVQVFDPENSISIKRQIADFEIDTEKAITIGIIINELLTNAFKYAFEDGDSGVVAVSIGKEESTVTIAIQDNGVGFDERTLKNESPGFGLTVVRMLAEQLGGTYSLSNEHGARSFVRFDV